MTKTLGRTSLANIINASLLIPKFEHIGNSCYVNMPVTSPTRTVTETIYVPTVSPTTTVIISTKPTIITVEGSEMTGGITYNNPILAEAFGIRIFSSVFNRFLTSEEVTILPTGGFTVLTGTYGVGDWFDVFPKWV